METELAAFCRPGTVPPRPEEIPAAAPASGVMLAHPVADADRSPRRRQMSPKDRSRTRMLLLLGAVLHLTAVGLLVAWLTGAFDRPPAPNTAPESKPAQKGDDEPVKKTRSRGT